MNGATALLWAKMMSAPKPSRKKIIGVSHHHLLCQKNESSSAKIPRRTARLSINLIRITSSSQRSLLDQIIPQDQDIQPAARQWGRPVAAFRERRAGAFSISEREWLPMKSVNPG